MEDLILMKKDLVCEITEYMDKFRDPKQCNLKYMYTYIFTKDSKPVIGTYNDVEDNEKYYFWYLRIPGYTCANVIFNKKDDTIEEIILTRRGGAFSDGMETMYLNPNKLEKELNKMFKGKKVNFYERKD